MEEVYCGHCGASGVAAGGAVLLSTDDLGGERGGAAMKLMGMVDEESWETWQWS
jgi:hypothetical protein